MTTPQTTLALIMNINKISPSSQRLTLLLENNQLITASVLTNKAKSLSATLRNFSLIECKLTTKDSYVNLGDAKAVLLYYDFFSEQMLYVASFYNEILLKTTTLANNQSIFLLYNALYSNLIKNDFVSLKPFLVLVLVFLGYFDYEKILPSDANLIRTGQFEEVLKLDFANITSDTLLNNLREYINIDIKTLNILQTIYPDLL